MKKTLIIHPFLFAIFPVLFLYSYNIEELPFSEIFLPSAIILVFTIIAVILLWLILKKDSKKAGITTTIFLIFFFSYGRVYELIKGLHLGTFLIGRHRYLMIIWLILFILCVYFTIRTRKDLKNFTNILNITAIVLILFPIVSIGIYKFNTSAIKRDSTTSGVEDTYESEDIEGLQDEELPDIYYIILDGYASSSTLKDFYNYDNSKFTDYLTEKGFFIASKSRGNYPMSYLSMASSLNMEYINYLSDIVGLESNDRTVPYEMIENNKVMNFLKSRGYKFIHFSSGWGPTNYNQYADINIAVSSRRWNEFQTLLIKTTMLDAFEKKFFKDIGRRRVLNTFTNLADVYKIEGKKFIFAHIVCPHPPYLFDENGNSVPEAEFNMDEWGSEQKEYYLNQLIFTNKKIETLVSEILSRSEIPPIIILQSDHGPRNTFIDGRYPTDDMFREGMRILNAYYLPSKGSDLIYDSITPVNTFRAILNCYFGTNYELLEDKSYNSFDFSPYKFTDVTDIVDFD